MNALKRFAAKLPVIRSFLIGVNFVRTEVRYHSKLLERQNLLEIESQLRDLYADPRYQEPKRLTRYEYQVNSQNGEDGIIAEIFARIGTTDRFFVEIGVGDGLENNSAYLLVQGWCGRWFEGSSADVEKIRAASPPSQLSVVQAIVTAENVETLLRDQGIPEVFDFLSIDIDGNDYWVWRAIEHFRPRVVAIEYNGHYPPPIRCVQKYDPHKVWDNSTYFGASLKSLEILGTAKGYNLVGCNIHGINAFFVRADLCADKFAAPYTAENHYEPFRLHLYRRLGYRRSLAQFENI